MVHFCRPVESFFLFLIVCMVGRYRYSEYETGSMKLPTSCRSIPCHLGMTLDPTSHFDEFGYYLLVRVSKVLKPLLVTIFI